MRVKFFRDTEIIIVIMGGAFGGIMAFYGVPMSFKHPDWILPTIIFILYAAIQQVYFIQLKNFYEKE